MKLPNRILASILFSLFACNIPSCHGFESAASRTKLVSPTSQQRISTHNHLATPASGSSGERMGSLKSLCDVSKRACDAVTPMVVAFYNSMHSAGTSKLKDDKSAFTIADGAVQHLLTDHLFGRPGSVSKFRGIVGEEDCAVNLSERPFTVDDLTIPEEFVPIVEKARRDISLLAEEIVDCDLYRSLTIFIDPIDGTREFSTGKGEECSICIGFADTQGAPVAGLVYRPITDPPTWAAGSKPEEYFAAELDMVAESAQNNKRGLLTSNGSISPFLGAFMNEMGYDQIRSGGAGNKMLMLLEGKGSAYIQDRGVSRWDTCAAQACIEAQGGILCKFTSFLEEKEDSYSYLESETNLDFEAGKSNLTMYNCGPSVGMNKSDPVRLATEVTEVTPYSNLCGIFAVAGKSNTTANKKTILAAAKAATKVSPPAFD